MRRRDFLRASLVVGMGLRPLVPDKAPPTDIIVALSPELRWLLGDSIRWVRMKVDTFSGETTVMEYF
jgi:hypothetical protein